MIGRGNPSRFYFSAQYSHKVGSADRQSATCDKAGQPNDVCPCGQVMSDSPDDVAFGYDVVPSAQWANITSLRPLGATSLCAKQITSFLRKQKHHFNFVPFDIDKNCFAVGTRMGFSLICG